MIRILFMIPTLGQGGAEKVLVNLVNNMDKKIFDITVKTLFDVGVNRQFLNSEVKYEYFLKKIFKGNSHVLKIFSPKFLYRKIIKDKYDIIVSYLEGPTARIVAGCNDNTVLVSWIHCTMHDEKEFSMGFRNFSEACNLYRKFDRCVFVSDDVENNFLRICNRKKGNTVLYNTVESNIILEKSNELIKSNTFLENEGMKLIAVGKVIPIKGFDRLARIHKKLIEEGYKIQTFILGIGEGKEQLEKYVLNEKIEDSFHFLGYHTNPYKYVKNSDLFICSSLSEGFSTAITEALIVGTPIVSTNVSGVKDLLGKNEYGLVTENNEESLYKGIKYMLDNSDMLQYYKNKAKERGESFKKEKTVYLVEKMFAELVKK